MRFPVILPVVRLQVLGALLLTGAAAFAQGWQAGVVAGVGLTRSVSVSTAKADLTRLQAFAVFLGQDVSRHFGGEIRYTLRPGDLRLRAGATGTKFRGQSHLVHYDFLIYSSPAGNAVRPFLAVGGGARVTRGTGVESSYQPLMEYALLTRTRQVQPVISLGAGVKVRLGKGLLFRAELHDYTSPFPDQVIAPAPGVRAGNWLHDLMPMVGIGCTF